MQGRGAALRYLERRLCLYPEAGLSFLSLSRLAFLLAHLAGAPGEAAADAAEAARLGDALGQSGVQARLQQLLSARGAPPPEPAAAASLLVSLAAVWCAAGAPRKALSPAALALLCDRLSSPSPRPEAGASLSEPGADGGAGADAPGPGLMDRLTPSALAALARALCTLHGAPREGGRGEGALAGPPPLSPDALFAAAGPILAASVEPGRADALDPDVVCAVPPAAPPQRSRRAPALLRRRRCCSVACPVSTEGWTRRVHFVREGGGGRGSALCAL